MPVSRQQLEELRARLRRSDSKLVQELAERFRISQEIHTALESGGAVPVDGTDRELLDRVEAEAEGALPSGAARAIFSQIAAAARQVERPARVAYVGPEGHFCHRMALGTFGPGAVLVESHTVQDAIDQVRRDRATYAVFAFDSSVDGLMLPAISALAASDLVLVAERSFSARLALMGSRDAAPPVEKIYSTAAGHAACGLFLESEYPAAMALDVRSMVEAAELARAERGALAIVPEETGRELGLELVRESVGDEPELRYRFGVAGMRPTSRTGEDTTCLLFSLDDEPGTLFRVLSHFAERGINLKKIQSRPVRGASWAYIFYVEVAGHATDRAVVTALEAVKGSTRYLKLLGSFPNES
jgi:chorismate mutase / prephenate dehydratase